MLARPPLSKTESNAHKFLHSLNSDAKTEELSQLTMPSLIFADKKGSLPGKGPREGLAGDIHVTGVNDANRTLFLKYIRRFEGRLVELDEEHSTKINNRCSEKVLGAGGIAKVESAFKRSIADLDSKITKFAPQFPIYKEIDELRERMCNSIILSPAKVEKNKEILSNYESAMTKLRKSSGENSAWKLPEDVKANGLTRDDALEFAKELKILVARNRTMEALFVEYAINGHLGSGDTIAFSEKVPEGTKAWIKTTKVEPVKARNAAIAKYGSEIYPLLYEHLAMTGNLGKHGKEYSPDGALFSPGLAAWAKENGSAELRDKLLVKNGLVFLPAFTDTYADWQAKVELAQLRAIAATRKKVSETLATLLEKDLPGFQQGAEIAAAYRNMDTARTKFMDADMHVAIKVKELGKLWTEGGDTELKALTDAYAKARGVEIEKLINDFKPIGVLVDEKALRKLSNTLPLAVYPGLR